MVRVNLLCLCRVKEMSPSECDVQYNIVGIYNAVCLKVPY